jgi:hypothetical protein
MPRSSHTTLPDSDNDGYSRATFPEWEEESRKKTLLNPRDPKPWLDLSTIYFFSMEWDKMTDAISTALLLDPGNSETRQLLASAYSNAGKARKSLATPSERLVSRHPIRITRLRSDLHIFILKIKDSRREYPIATRFTIDDALKWKLTSDGTKNASVIDSYSGAIQH